MADSYACMVMVCKNLGRSCQPGCAFVALMEQQGCSITPSKLEVLCGFYNVSFIDGLTPTPTPETLKTLDVMLSDLYYRYLFYLENQSGNLIVVLTSMEDHIRDLLEKFDKEEEAIRAGISNTTLDPEKSMRQMEMDMELIE